MATHASRNNQALAAFKGKGLIEQFKNGIKPTQPWKSIEEFVTSPKYLGYKPYPKQMTLLKLIFLETDNMTAFDIKTIEEWRAGFGGKESYGIQPDIWHRIKWLKDRGYRRFPHVQNVMGRRGGKGWIGAILAAELISYMITLDNWQDYYGIQPGKKCEISVLATNLDQAKKFQFLDISTAVNDCAFLRPYINQNNEYLLTVYTPHDLRQMATRKALSGKDTDKDQASIRVQAMPAGSASGRGGAGLANFFDEFAFMLNGTGGPADSANVYKAYQPALKQFKKDGLTYIPSSPLTKVGKFYDLYQEGCVLMPEYLEEIGQELHSDNEDEIAEAVAKPTMLIYQNSSWAIYEEFEKALELYGYKIREAVMLYDDEAKLEERVNKEVFKVEYKGQFAEVQAAYLDPDKVDEMFAPFWGGRTLSPTKYGILDFAYHAHIDPSSVQANFALCIAHLEDAPPDEHGLIWPHVIVDYLKVWKPEDFEDGMVDYVEITTEIKEQVFGKFASLREFTTDQYNLPGLLSMLRQAKHSVTIREENFNKKSNMDRAERFKGALNLGWIHSYKDNYFNDGQASLLEMELKFLSEKNGQVVKQEIGPVTTKDLADCLMVVSVRLLTRELDNYHAKMMGALMPSFSPASRTQVVDNASPLVALKDDRAAQNRENMAAMSSGRGNRTGYTGAR